MKRCDWAQKTEIEQQYHDTEWGRVLHDEQRLFELLILEGQQAGLSWITILKKREHMRQAYDQFAPEIMAQYGEEKKEALMNDPGVIRNRRKIEAAVVNAQAYLELLKSDGGLDPFLWGYVNNQPIQNAWAAHEEVPAKTPLSEQISRDLKNKGFLFVGPTIVYAYMQSIGMVNDHLLHCDLYAEVQQ